MLTEWSSTKTTLRADTAPANQPPPPCPPAFPPTPEPAPAGPAFAADTFPAAVPGTVPVDAGVGLGPPRTGVGGGSLSSAAPGDALNTTVDSNAPGWRAPRRPSLRRALISS